MRERGSLIPPKKSVAAKKSTGVGSKLYDANAPYDSLLFYISLSSPGPPLSWAEPESIYIYRSFEKGDSLAFPS